MRQLLQRLLTLSFYRLLDLGRSRCDATFKRLGTHVEPVPVQKKVSKIEMQLGTTSVCSISLRVTENVHGDLIAVLVQGFLDIKRPQQPCDRQESALFGQPLTAANSPAPAKCHIALLIGEWTMERVILEESFGTESVGLREVLLISMDGPDVALDPSVLGNVPTL